jgi:hypothetical protein
VTHHVGNRSILKTSYFLSLCLDRPLAFRLHCSDSLTVCVESLTSVWM